MLRRPAKLRHLNGSTIAAFCFVISIVLSLASIISTTRKMPIDFATLYAGGAAVRGGQDPYSQAVICSIEHQVSPGQLCFPFPYPPPFTAVMLPLSYLPFHLAAYLWVGLMVACAIALTFVVARLSEVSLRGPIALCLVIAATLVFAPMKHGFATGQSDALSGLLAVASIAVATVTPRRAGVLAALAVFVKPQTVALPMLALVWKRPKVVSGIVLATIGTAVTLVLLGGSPATLIAWAKVAATVRATPHPLLTVFQLALAAASLIWVGIRWRNQKIGVVKLCASAAALTAIVGSLVHLQTDSLTLLILPLLLVLRPWIISTGPPPIRVAVALGVICGLLSGDAVFAVSYNAGWSHAIIPWITAAAFGAGVVLLRRSLAFITLTALFTNLVITFPPLPPPTQTVFGALAGFGLLIILGIEGFRSHPTVGRDRDGSPLVTSVVRS